MNRNDYPVPHVQPLEDWKQVPIRENKEELISLKNVDSELLVVVPQYHEMGLPGALNDCYVRREVAIKLVDAARNLPNGHKLMIWDGWRPFAVQKQLYDSYLMKLSQEHPEWSEERLREGTRQFVSYPSESEAAPAPHITGGAVDVTVVDGNGDPLPMGTEFDDFNEQAWTHYYDEKKADGEKLSEEEETFLKNRKLLNHVMTSSGFTNYPAEWWHFDYGNQWWAKRSEEPAAKYGLVHLEV
ncbi:M15 family metallopeptidase [Alkalihalobacillus sp. TS-13]|uniref:M15 family metallopeptidase n=1 Tax=Alkalihalobacillus sp. TS-13 TaxID=2842455 RepID=UPI001C868501|nr:M15 family metallopeptidase [Alkalihalobacillus sp. TS-13]